LPTGETIMNAPELEIGGRGVRPNPLKKLGDLFLRHTYQHANLRRALSRHILEVFAEGVGDLPHRGALRHHEISVDKQAS